MNNQQSISLQQQQWQQRQLQQITVRKKETKKLTGGVVVHSRSRRGNRFFHPLLLLRLVPKHFGLNEEVHRVETSGTSSELDQGTLGWRSIFFVRHHVHVGSFFQKKPHHLRHVVLNGQAQNGDSDNNSGIENRGGQGRQVNFQYLILRLNIPGHRQRLLSVELQENMEQR